MVRDAERAYTAHWEPSTRNGHGAGLIRFAEYCDVRQVPEIDRFPLTVELAVGFIGWAAGQMGQSAVCTWMSGLRAWHIVHGFQYTVKDSIHVKTALAGVGKLAPTKSKCPPHIPVTIQHLNTLYLGLEFTNSIDIAVWAVACAAFWGLT